MQAPTDVATQQVTVQLPAGTACTGGTAGNLCLVSFKTAGGFGNCVVVQKAAAAATSKTGAAKKGTGKRELDIRAVVRVKCFAFSDSY